IRGVKELPASLMNHVLSCPLWKPMFRHGLSGLPGDKKLALASPDTDKEVPAPLGDELVDFLKEFACWDPLQDSSDNRTELMRALLVTCKKQPIRNEIAAGSKVDQAVNATWAAMV
ncbi:hypothetical protein M9458_011694, partial [Cirrhinus mrigala]